MRILLVSAYDLSRPGGVQSHIHSLAEALRQRGHDVKCVGPGQQGLGAAKSISLSGTGFEVSFVSRVSLQQFLKEMAAWTPDVVHVHGIWVPFLPIQILRTVPAARVVTFHDTTAPSFSGFLLRQAFKVLSRLVLANVDAAIVVSRLPLAHLRPGRNGVKPVILSPAVDLAPFTKLRRKAKAGRPVVLYWGRLEPRKNIGTLSEAIKLIAAGQDELAPHFVIAGAGVDAGKVLALQQQLGDEWISFVSPPDPAGLLELIAKASLAVFPAAYGESFGIVLAEAMASGLPILAADNAGYSDMLGAEGADMLFAKHDASALADRIMALLADKAPRDAQIAAGQRIAASHDVIQQIEKFETIYREAVIRHQSSKREA
ncbi:glycosyltransferase family 4 protein [Aestuariivirga litoralis]|uniref:glycosyltransferase family 4 protein n=1 Tax=Aestuariivirga litoralis TaxID=2650924 RepID=UPI0018C572BE|nr:glycosyltransferase family 4 protein [Aestuariivirga litoralis]MBG1230784.1 glycosyltransferase family 4 protein [Aestuariivirga litoralis]